MKKYFILLTAGLGLTLISCNSKSSSSVSSGPSAGEQKETVAAANEAKTISLKVTGMR